MTAATETSKDRVMTLLLGWPSLTVTVMVAVPFASASGVNLSVPVALGLAYVMTGAGIRVGLLEVAVTVRTWLSLGAPEVIPERATVCRPASSRMARLPKGLRVGGSFTGFTVRTKLLLALRVPLLATIVMVAVPERLDCGVMPTVKFGADPVRTIFACGTNVESEEDAVKLKPEEFVPAETEKDTNFDVSSGVTWAEIAEITGGLLEGGETVSTNVVAAVRNPSFTEMVMAACPAWPAAGVSCTVRLEPLPPKTMLLTGTRDESDVEAERIRLDTDESPSRTVKGMGIRLCRA